VRLEVLEKSALGARLPRAGGEAWEGWDTAELLEVAGSGWMGSCGLACAGAAMVLFFFFWPGRSNGASSGGHTSADVGNSLPTL
jgi:hypothetical protein